MRALAMLVILAGCVADSTVPCGDLRCPAGDTCTPAGCATADAITACDGAKARTACTTRAIAQGVCHDGACWPVVCGDGFADPGEVCDDGNTVAGDGCSAACDSSEVCGNDIVDVVAGEQCDSGIPGLSHDGCSSRCASELLVLADVSPADITPRADMAIGYDAKANQMILFGGNLGSSLGGDTWQFSGTQWVPRNVANPPPVRYRAAMAYDPNSGQLILFGGAGATGPLDDTWAWDGTRWTQLHPPVSPPARWGAAIAVDTDRARVVIYGGVGAATVFSDAWEWDGATWKQLASSSTPGPLSAATMAYDPQRKQLVLVGGLDQTGAQQTKAWTGSGSPTWTEIAASGPGARAFASMVYDEGRGQLVLFGGAVDQRVWLWDGTQWTPMSYAGAPVGRFGAGMIAAGPGEVLFGGLDVSNVLHGDTFVLTPAGWGGIGPAKLSPPPRWGAMAAFDPRGGAALLFGGQGGGQLLADTWLWLGGVWVDLASNVAPPARYSGVLVDEQARGSLLLFGGSDGTGRWMRDTWRFGPDNGWHPLTTATAPPPFVAAAAGYDRERDRVVVFGTAGAGAETWEWDGATWSPRAMTGPLPRTGAMMAFDPVLHGMLLFGGAAATHFGDTWLWDGQSWHELHPATSPLPRAFGTLTLDPLRDRLLLIGGEGGGLTLFGEVWEWDGATWTQVQPVPASILVTRHQAFYDPLLGGVVTFGGLDPSQFPRGRTNLYTSQSVIGPNELCESAAGDDDGDGLAGCADPDCWGRCAPLCPPGQPCASDAPHCGDGTCQNVEDAFICPLDCP